MDTWDALEMRYVCVCEWERCQTVEFSLQEVNFTNLLTQNINVPAVIVLNQRSLACTNQFHQQNYAQLYL